MNNKERSEPTEQFEASTHFDESLAAKYEQRIRLFCPSYDALHHMIAPLVRGLPERAHFLSVGAGTGAEILALGKHFPSWRFLALDVSSDMLNVCRGRVARAGMAERVDFFNGRMQEFGGQAVFDAASSVFVSHFIKGHEEKLAYFRSISSLLRPGGLFILADLFADRNRPEFMQLLEAWLASYASHGVSSEELNKDRTHVENDIAYIPEAELASLLKDAGFATPVRFYQTYLFGGWIVRKHS